MQEMHLYMLHVYLFFLVMLTLLTLIIGLFQYLTFCREAGHYASAKMRGFFFLYSNPT